MNTSKKLAKEALARLERGRFAVCLRRPADDPGGYVMGDVSTRDLARVVAFAKSVLDADTLETRTCQGCERGLPLDGYGHHYGRISNTGPLAPYYLDLTVCTAQNARDRKETGVPQALKEIAEICDTDYGPAAMARVAGIVRRAQETPVFRCHFRAFGTMPCQLPGGHEGPHSCGDSISPQCTRCGRTEVGCKDPRCPWPHLKTEACKHSNVGPCDGCKQEYEDDRTR